jgi:hypothetical protein
VLAKAGLGIMHIAGTARNLEGFDPEKGKKLVGDAVYKERGI